MKKSELKQLIKEVLQEIRLTESKAGLSGFKKVSDSKDNTQMGYEDKTLTSTSEPKEKEESKKLPVVKKPSEPKKEGSINEDIKVKLMKMIRETVEEYRTKGALGRSNANRTTPLKKYVPKGMTGMGRPSKAAAAKEAGQVDSIVSVVVDGQPVGEFNLDLRMPSGKPDLQPGALKKHLDAFHEANGLAELGFFAPEVYNEFEKLSDQWVDGALADNAVIDLVSKADSAGLKTLFPK